MKYGTDKPDLRNPLIIYDLRIYFLERMLNLKFQKISKGGSNVRAIYYKKYKRKPRSFFDNIDKWAKEQGATGLAYFLREKNKNHLVKDQLENFLVKML